MDNYYYEWRRRALLNRLKYGRALVIVGMMFFVVLDVLAHREAALELLGWRIGAVLFVALTWLADYTRFGQRYPQVVMVAATLGVTIPMAAMTVVLGGFPSSYYSGIPLIFAGAAAFFPWFWSAHLVGQLITMVFYFSVNFYFHGTADFSPHGWEALFFLCWYFALFDATIFAYEHIFHDEYVIKTDLEKAHKMIQDRERTKSKYFTDKNIELRSWLDEIDRIASSGSEASAENTKSALAEIGENIMPLRRLITNFLDYSLLENESYPVEITNFDLRSVTADAVDSMQERLEEKKNTIKMNFADSCAVASDREIISQAIKRVLYFMNGLGKGATIRINGGTEQGIRGEQVTLEFSGEGFGLAAEQRTIAFLPFMRSGPEYSLDLPNTRLKIRLLGGDITIGGTMGKRTVFTLTLPIEYKPSGREEIYRAFASISDKPDTGK